jgi:RepB DNA-primase from phage plasmid
MLMRDITASDYIRENYKLADRLAVVIKFQNGSLLQRITTAGRIAAPEFQSWLQEQNERNGNVYLSVNALATAAFARTRNDIQDVRHVYLDIDVDGDAVLRRILHDSRVPEPSFVLNTSPGRYQTVWKVDGFSMGLAETLQRAMALTFRADRAVVDAARVLRLPNFSNWKYDPPHRVTADKRSTDTYRPEPFQIPTPVFDDPVMRRMLPRRFEISQSERDWAETMRRLSQGEDPGRVQAWLAEKRQDKRRPAAYAELTVRKALTELDRRRACQADPELSLV